MLSRVFRSGNSQAVRIPKDLAFDPGVHEVEIERHGDGLLIRPAKRESFEGLAAALAAFPSGFMTDGRAPQDQAEREWPDIPSDSR
ncbi:type II toxin-antitoxin system VapB family antitoxin [Burkholderiaceae bacterium FT117]|uniref:antitoxin n=1 Tax=Zeimonas sediminis TaxID=2944268 RepID=UPI002343012D|nr:type II toxin-antitoxin system VapB family antitoxin [Zeimonas sediminis]MCM5571225.1 type II toxin-antitoxin system VapB family antitoxin [Zeimonas sediminis]